MKKPPPGFPRAELRPGLQALPSRWARLGPACVLIPGSSWLGTEGTDLPGVGGGGTEARAFSCLGLGVHSLQLQACAPLQPAPLPEAAAHLEEEQSLL